MPMMNSTRMARLARPVASTGTCYQGVVTVTAGQTFKIETAPGGDDLLEIVVPAGKVYTVSLRVEYEVADA